MSNAETTSADKSSQVMIGAHVDKETHLRIRVTAAQQGLTMAKWIKQVVYNSLPPQSEEDQNVS